MLSRREMVAAVTGSVMIPLTGCSEVLPVVGDDPPPVEALDATIVDIRTPGTGLTSATIPVVLEMVNTHSSDEIPLPTVDYDAYINDSLVASARKDIASLGPGDTALEVFEVIAQYTDIGGGIVDAIENRSFGVRIEGEIESKGASTTFESQYEL